MYQDDNEIIQNVLHGDTNAYAILVRRYKDKAYSTAMGILGDPNLAQEAVQEAYVRAYRGLHSFKFDAAFSTWLYRIVYNQCLTLSARRKTHNQRHTDLPEDDLLLFDSESPSSALESEEFNRIVNREIQNMPVHYRSVLTLYFLHERSYQSISEILDIPIGTVKIRLHRARQLLKETVLSYYTTPASAPEPLVTK